MARTVVRLTKIWLMLAVRAAQIQILTHWGGYLFLLGKIIRFLMFFVFLFAVLSSAKTMAGYTREQVILFFLVFNLVDMMIQFLFRGIYFFRFLVISGQFDLDLLKPLPSFFRPLFGYTDFLDFMTLVPLWIYFLWFVFTYHLLSNFFQFFFFLAFLLNSLILAFAFHLFVAAVGVLTTEIDHLIMVYRDLSNMARFPTDIYHQGVQTLLTFVVPVVILITIPAKVLMGLLSLQEVIFSFIISSLFLAASLSFWKYALTSYSSASG